MPYKSQAQRRKFHALLAKGEISASTVKEWDRASKGKKLPERVKKQAGTVVAGGIEAGLKREAATKEKQMNKCGAFERIFFNERPSQSQKELADRLTLFTHVANNDKTAAEKGSDITDEQLNLAMMKRAASLTPGEQLIYRFAPSDAFAQG